MKKLEPAAWITLLLVLAGLNLVEGRRNLALAASLPVKAPELYRLLARSQSPVQLVDARADLAEFEDAHIPGAIPFPGCDPSKAPAAAVAQLLESAPTILVTSGDEPACAAYFRNARRLEGGMEAWSDANYPEDTGEYSPPRTSAGGGCL